jgi:hypothetical protein
MDTDILKLDDCVINFATFTVSKTDLEDGSAKEYELIEMDYEYFRYGDHRFTWQQCTKITKAYGAYIFKLQKDQPQFFETKVGKNLLLDESVVLNNPDLSEFDYPFSFEDIINYKNLDSKDVTEHPVLTLDTSDKLIWFLQNGENDGESWILILKTSDNIYCYYEASCDYTGFDCRGSIDLFYSSDPNKLWTMGLSNSVRTQMKQRLHGCLTKYKK